MRLLFKSLGVGLGMGASLALLLASLALVGPGVACCPLPPAAGQAQASGLLGEANAFDPARYRGKVLVVNLMAEGCAGCWAELSGLERVYRAYRGRGLAVLGIAVGSSGEGILRLAKRFGLSYPIYLDPEGRLLERRRLTGMPSILVYDKSGRLVRSLRGEVPEPELRAIVEGLL